MNSVGTPLLIWVPSIYIKAFIFNLNERKIREDNLCKNDMQSVIHKPNVDRRLSRVWAFCDIASHLLMWSEKQQARLGGSGMETMSTDPAENAEGYVRTQMRPKSKGHYTRPHLMATRPRH